MVFYHPYVLGECVGGHKIVCDEEICAGKGNELRTSGYELGASADERYRTGSIRWTGT
jgi:hypothetical protein